MAKVRAHTRTVRGRRQRVKPHSRKLQPRRAGRNARRAYRAARRKRHSDAIVWGSVAATEISAWVLFRTTGWTLTAIGLALVGVGIAARRMT
jgi:hypothetical protein